MFRTVSQISINYRHSPISQGLPGTISPGDRLPWLWENDVCFLQWNWQAHVYGDPGESLSATCERMQIHLKIFKWRRDFAKSGIKKDALYVIRPDMHIGHISSEATNENLLKYFREYL